MMLDNDTKTPLGDEEAAKIEDAILGSTTIDGLRHSTQIPLLPCITKVGFNNKLYSDGTSKDGIVHITVGCRPQQQSPVLY
jgi:hypothetical protein